MRPAIFHLASSSPSWALCISPTNFWSSLEWYCCRQCLHEFSQGNGKTGIEVPSSSFLGLRLNKAGSGRAMITVHALFQIDRIRWNNTKADVKNCISTLSWIRRKSLEYQRVFRIVLLSNSPCKLLLVKWFWFLRQWWSIWKLNLTGVYAFWDRWSTTSWCSVLVISLTVDISGPDLIRWECWYSQGSL